MGWNGRDSKGMGAWEPLEEGWLSTLSSSDPFNWVR